MNKINTVIKGDFLGNNVSCSLGTVSISISTWKSEIININNVECVEYLQDVINKKNEHSAVINVKFRSGKECVIWVDDGILGKILEIWPENKLASLLQKGYKIVGYSSCMLATSGLGAGSMAHNILLQKDFNISKVTIITNGTKEMGRNFHIFSCID